jgi:hypothetical protein
MSNFLENLPIHTAKIFEILSSGKFVCSLSKTHRDEYETLADSQHYENLQAYFRLLNYELEKENGYFYFSKINQDRQKAEDKIERLSTYIDIFAFFAAMDSKPTTGIVLRPSQIVEELNSNPALQNRLATVQLKEVKEATTYLGKVKAILKALADDFFIEKRNDEQDNYLVLDSFQYLQTIISLINPDETPA